MNKPISVTMIDKETGSWHTLPVMSDTVYISCLNEGMPPTDITTSFEFKCCLNKIQYDDELSAIYKETRQWDQAERLADELNNLVEEYHAPGTPRRERRAINREFNKIFRIFLKHCRHWQIDYTFKRTSK